MRKTGIISQKEARRLRARVQQLERAEEERRRVWARDYPGGIHLGRLTLTPDHRLFVSALTAKKLKHAVVIAVSEPNLDFYALPPGES